MSEYIIDEDVQKVLDALADPTKQIIYVAGKAGTGKSSLIKYITENTTKNYALVAFTGIAAINIGGTTIHSLFRLPPRMVDKRDLKPSYDDVLKNLDLLLIDEISLCRSDILDNIDTILRLTKKINRPFGGTKILLVGDTFQLSPIVGKSEESFFHDIYQSPWFFDAHVFQEIEVESIELKHVYRQKDKEFVDALNNIRSKTNLPETVAWFNSKCLKKKKSKGIVLAVTNKTVDSTNEEALKKIKEPMFTYTGMIIGKMGVDGEKLPSPMVLNLKKSAPVMITKNLEGGISNGDLGVVEECFDNHVNVRMANGMLVKIHKEKWESYAYEYDKETKRIKSKATGSYQQLPITLGAARTIFKAQGLTINTATLNFGNYVFAPSIVYVGLSRLTSIDGLTLSRPLRESDIIIDDRVINFHKMNFGDPDE